jgi:uncharacterized paraquat-inducible protein A
MIRVNLLANRSRSAAKFQRFIAALPLEPGHTAELRAAQPVVCGDCGPVIDRHRLERAGCDTCPQCGGHAEQLRNETLSNRGGAAA